MNYASDKQVQYDGAAGDATTRGIKERCDRLRWMRGQSEVQTSVRHKDEDEDGRIVGWSIAEGDERGLP